jgi:hypothetical protein
MHDEDKGRSIAMRSSTKRTTIARFGALAFPEALARHSAIGRGTAIARRSIADLR